MKYREFKEKMEQMGLTVGENEYAIWATTPRQKGKIVVVAKDLRFRVTVPHHLPMEDAAKLEGVLINTTRLACTPLEDREEEKKSRYRLPVIVGFMPAYIYKTSKGIGVSTESDYLSGSEYFTDREVEQYTGKERVLFDACIKEEVQ